LWVGKVIELFTVIWAEPKAADSPTALEIRKS